MRIIFMGTPDFAVPSLKKLIESRHEVIAVFSQPDKPVGRKQILTPPPVKVVAQENNIPVYQPRSLKNEDVTNLINSLNADIIIVIAYGKILPKSVLEATKFGCVNVHASLLPKYRGAAPIQWSILNGDDKTGVTIMQMDEGLDTGDMLCVTETDIDINETSEMLFERLSVLGSDSLLTTLEKLEKGDIKPIPQPEGDYGYAQKITKTMSPIDFTKSAFEVHNHIRALQSWPCASTVILGKNVKIHSSVLCDETGRIAGEVVNNKDCLTVSCGDCKCIKILELQLEGKKRMDTKSFLLGFKIPIGTILGE